MISMDHLKAHPVWAAAAGMAPFSRELAAFAASMATAEDHYDAQSTIDEIAARARTAIQ
jgi:hypothetical protein